MSGSLGEQPVVSGRLGVRIDAIGSQAAQSVNAGFELQGDGTSGELRLNSPLGTRIASARWSPGSAVLTDSDGEQRFVTLDELSRKALGETLPLAALPDWLAGRPWPGAAHHRVGRRLRAARLAGSAGAARRGLGRSQALGRACRRAARAARPCAMTLRALHDVPAPAKLNLFLHIVGRRADGYHLLQSPFVLIDWADTLQFELRSDGRLQRHDLGAELPADDLCLRAARALQSASGTALGADISIAKRVPWGAGMGGGSSDAATTLLALNRLWGLNWPRKRLAEIGLAQGADVPFFIGGRNAFVEGIGELLTPITVPQRLYAVVKPPATITTRDIFEHPALERSRGADIVAGSPEEAFASLRGNDLQAVAEIVCPEVAQAAAWLQSRYGNSRMTGSGSAVFSRVGLEDGMSSGARMPPAAPTAAFPADELPAGWVGRLCRGLAEHPLVSWAD